MTTTVLIGTQGNKAVKVSTPGGDFTLPPGRWFTFGIHGDQQISVSEVGDFVDGGPGLTPVPKAAEASAATAG